MAMSKEENIALVRRFFSVGPSGGDLKSADELWVLEPRPACASCLIARNSGDERDNLSLSGCL